MKLLAIPNFGERVSPRIDYAETLQLIKIEDRKVVQKDTIKIITPSNLERMNQIIRLKPDVIICDGISNLLYDKLLENNIELIPWVHGRISDIIDKFLAGEIKVTNKQ